MSGLSDLYIVLLSFCLKQNFNADYQLTAKQGADTLAFVSLVQNKLYPAIVSYTYKYTGSDFNYCYNRGLRMWGWFCSSGLTIQGGGFLLEEITSKSFPCLWRPVAFPVKIENKNLLEWIHIYMSLFKLGVLVSAQEVLYVTTITPLRRLATVSSTFRTA